MRVVLKDKRMAKIVINAYASNLRVFCKISKLITEDRQCSLLHKQTCNVSFGLSLKESNNSLTERVLFYDKEL